MIIVCWNMQGTGYPGADAFAELVSRWGVDVVIMLEPPEWAHNSRLLGSARDAARWRMDYWRQHAGDRPDKHHGSITTISGPGVTVRQKGDLYPESGMEMPRQLLILKITKGAEVRRVATCHAPFGGGAFLFYVKDAVRELAKFSETPHGAKQHVHPVDIWIGDLNTAGDHSPDGQRWVLKFAKATTKSGAAGGSPRDKVLVRTGSDLVANARAGRVLGRNAHAQGADWQIPDWDSEVSSDHSPVFIDTGGAAVAAAAPPPAAAAAAAAEPEQKRPSLSRQFQDIAKSKK